MSGSSSDPDLTGEPAPRRPSIFDAPASDVASRESEVSGPPPAELTEPLAPPEDAVTVAHRESFWSRNGARLLGFGCAALVCFYYAWLVSLGHISNWPAPYDGYFGAQANAFAAGQTYLLQEPRPELLALSDPYEPSLNGAFRMHDALLYKAADGTWQYYLYWGPVPALLMVPFKAIPTVPWRVADFNLTLAFAVVLTFGLAATIVRVRERLFPGAPWWMVGPTVLAAGLVGPMPYMMARSAIYEGAIIGAHAFLVWGILLALLGLDGAKPKWWLLGPAGVLWTLAVGTRYSLCLPVTALAILVTIALARWWWTAGDADVRRARRKKALLAFGAMAAPLFAGAIALAMYNKVRFGGFTDFGMQYQLAGLNVRQEYLTGRGMMRADMIAPNLARYLFEWFQVTEEFPFLVPSGGRPAFIGRWGLPPATYGMDKVVGVVWYAPYFLLGTIPLFATLLGGWRSDSRRASLLTLALLATAVLGVLPSLYMIGSVMRYQLDGAPYWAVLAAVGTFQWAAWARRRGRGAGVAYLVVLQLAFVSTLLGVVLGFSGDNWSMRQHNPELWQKLSVYATYLRP